MFKSLREHIHSRVSRWWVTSTSSHSNSTVVIRWWKLQHVRTKHQSKFSTKLKTLSNIATSFGWVLPLHSLKLNPIEKPDTYILMVTKIAWKLSSTLQSGIISYLLMITFINKLKLYRIMSTSALTCVYLRKALECVLIKNLGLWDTSQRGLTINRKNTKIGAETPKYIKIGLLKIYHQSQTEQLK